MTSRVCNDPDTVVTKTKELDVKGFDQSELLEASMKLCEVLSRALLCMFILFRQSHFTKTPSIGS